MGDWAWTFFLPAKPELVPPTKVQTLPRIFCWPMWFNVQIRDMEEMLLLPFPSFWPYKWIQYLWPRWESLNPHVRGLASGWKNPYFHWLEMAHSLAVAFSRQISFWLHKAYVFTPPAMICVTDLTTLPFCYLWRLCTCGSLVKTHILRKKKKKKKCPLPLWKQFKRDRPAFSFPILLPLRLQFSSSSFLALHTEDLRFNICHCQIGVIFTMPFGNMISLLPVAAYNRGNKKLGKCLERKHFYTYQGQPKSSSAFLCLHTDEPKRYCFLSYAKMC